MPLYVYKWENGDFSAVNARNKEEAVERLDDEVDFPDINKLLVCKDFMVNFKLPQKVTADNADDMLPPISLENFGEDTVLFLARKIYSKYDQETGKILDEKAHGMTISSEEELERLNGALATEKMMLKQDEI